MKCERRMLKPFTREETRSVYVRVYLTSIISRRASRYSPDEVSSAGGLSISAEEVFFGQLCSRGLSRSHQLWQVLSLQQHLWTFKCSTAGFFGWLHIRELPQFHKSWEVLCLQLGVPFAELQVQHSGFLWAASQQRISTIA